MLMRRHKMVIHSEFEQYASFVKRIPSDFLNMGAVIHKDRNEVRLVRKGETTFVIKSFDRITMANRIIYTFFRKSKAIRAYDNALSLFKRGIATPAPVAHIDLHKGILLQDSYFVSVYEDAMSLNEAVEKPLAESREVIKAFARFVYQLHAKGIFHRDLHLENVLLKGDSSGFQFLLIDINRLKFQSPTRRRKSKNLIRIYMSFEKYAVFINEYAVQSKLNPYKVLLKTSYYKQLKTGFRRIRKGFKSALKPIPN